MTEKTVLPLPGIRFHYNLVTRVFGPALFRVMGGFHVTGQEHLPASGPGLICPNHVSYLDPPLVGIAHNQRHCCFMAKASLFKIPLLGAFIRASYSYPVDRDEGGRQALRIANELLEAGELVILFPEGTRSHTGDLLRGQHGAAFIAARAHVPVIPAAVWGTNLVMPVHATRLHRAPVYVRFGEPLLPPEPEGGDRPSKPQLRAFTDQVMARIAALQAELRAEVPPRWREYELRQQAIWRARLKAAGQDDSGVPVPPEPLAAPGDE